MLRTFISVKRICANILLLATILMTVSIRTASAQIATAPAGISTYSYPAPTVVSPIRYSIDIGIRDLRNEIMPGFDYSYDSYLQFALAPVVLGMKACGYESRTKWGGMIVSDALSIGIVTVGTLGFKLAVKRMRPDGSEANSFTSGHTGRAFAAAAILDKEYGWRSPWFSIGGYTLATVTGLTRIMNNRHWISDAVVGAALGIGSVHLGYYLTDLIFKDKHIYDGYVKPVFEYDSKQKHYVAELLFGRRFILGNSQAGMPQKGSLAGLQTDIPLIPGTGITARATAGTLRYSDSSIADIYGITAGGYWNLAFAKRFEFQARAGAGYSRLDEQGGIDFTVGTGISLILSNNFKAKLLAEYESVGLFPSHPWINSFILGYSVSWFI